MTIFLLVDDPPEEHGEFRILAAFLYRSKATKELRKLKSQDEYTYQYLEIKNQGVNLEEK